MIIILLSIIQGQDTLITRTGTEYIGKLISLDKTYVTFYYQDENRTVPIRTVERISMESGATINLYTNHLPPGDSTSIKNMNNERGVIALEKIASVQTFFMYYTIISTTLIILALLAKF